MRIDLRLLLPLLLAAASCLADEAAPPSPAGGLIRNGDFETADPEDPCRPRDWDRPDGLGVVWTNAPVSGDGKPRGMAIRVNTRVSEQAMVAQWKKTGNTSWDIPQPAANAIAATYGLSYYSHTVPVRTGQAYRITFDLKAPQSGEGAKVWVRASGFIKGKWRRRYETVVNCRASGTDWAEFSHAFFPSKYRPDATEMKVMLYAYWPPGVYWFDNVRLEPVSTEEYERFRAEESPDPR